MRNAKQKPFYKFPIERFRKTKTNRKFDITIKEIILKKIDFTNFSAKKNEIKINYVRVHTPRTYTRTCIPGGQPEFSAWLGIVNFQGTKKSPFNSSYFKSAALILSQPNSTPKLR